jgi:hypothetical protein
VAQVVGAHLRGQGAGAGAAQGRQAPRKPCSAPCATHPGWRARRARRGRHWQAAGRAGCCGVRTHNPRTYPTPPSAYPHPDPHPDPQPDPHPSPSPSLRPSPS